MKLLLIFSLLLIICCGCGKNFEGQPIASKIYGGELAGYHQWQSVVALTHRKDGQFCSGIAISPNEVLTAAHCLLNYKNILDQVSIYVGRGKSGSYYGKYSISSYRIHPNYDSDAYDSPFDFALIKVSRNLALSRRDIVKPLKKTEAWDVLSIRQQVTIVGFGEISEENQGRKYFTQTQIWKIDDYEFYAGGGGHDSCHGDSGGPALVRLSDGSLRLMGITSRPAYSGSTQCGFGSIYGSVVEIDSWLNQKTR